jgi:ribulose 1,5-bisphosphate synthetase/thiazole synthase
VVFSPDYLAQPLTPNPLPTKDGAVLRTIDDARAYMLALSKEREWRDHWKAAYRLLVVGAGVAELTQQVQLALTRDGQLDVEAFEHMRALGGGDETGN